MEKEEREKERTFPQKVFPSRIWLLHNRLFIQTSRPASRHGGVVGALRIFSDASAAALPGVHRHADRSVSAQYASRQSTNAACTKHDAAPGNCPLLRLRFGIRVFHRVPQPGGNLSGTLQGRRTARKNEETFTMKEPFYGSTDSSNSRFGRWRRRYSPGGIPEFRRNAR